MGLWQFGARHWWSVEIEERLSAGSFSPSGSRLVTFHNTHHSTRICVWDTRDGLQRQAHLLADQSWLTPDFPIEFETEDQFCFQHETCRILYVISPVEPGASTYSIICRGQLPPSGQPRRRYDLDDTREWVVCSSKRVCWIPPGYIGWDEGSYCWVGNTLFMLGQGEILRKLTFDDDFEG